MCNKGCVVAHGSSCPQFSATPRGHHCSTAPALLRVFPLTGIAQATTLRENDLHHLTYLEKEEHPEMLLVYPEVFSVPGLAAVQGDNA